MRGVSEGYGIVCNECRTIVASEAERCPNCGASFVPDERPVPSPADVAPATVEPPAPPIAATRELAAFYASIASDRASGARAYGGFWIRTAAYVIDAVLIAAAGLLLSFPVGVWAGLFGLVHWLYFPVMESGRWQGTVGKYLLGLQVIGKDGRQISFARAIVRFFAKIPSALLFGLGFFMVGWTKRKRGLHDMIASTYVAHR